jgi:hypothetical protein
MMRGVSGRRIVVPVVIFIVAVVAWAAWYLFFGPGSPSHHMGS